MNFLFENLLFGDLFMFIAFPVASCTLIVRKLEDLAF
jgi:hypothetical protein